MACAFRERRRAYASVSATVKLSELLILEGLSLGKTLTQIAGDLAVGESAVSRSLSQMERGLGLQIVDRHQHRLRLTPTGRDLARAASQMAQHLRDFDEVVDQYRRGETGTVRVLSSNAPANYLLPNVINDFLERYPNADVQLHVESGHIVWPVFSRGQHDVGIGPADRPPNLASVLPETAWSLQPLYEDAIVLFVSSSNPLARRRDVPLEALAGRTFAGMFGDPFWTRFLEHLAAKGLEIRRRVELKGIEGVKRLVESGESVGVHLMSTIDRDVAEGRLATLNVPDLEAPYRYLLAHRANQGRSSLAYGFCELVRRYASERKTANRRNASKR